MPLCWIWVLGPISHPYTPGCETVSSHTGGLLWDMRTPRGQLEWPKRSLKNEGILNDQLKHRHLHLTPPSFLSPMTTSLLLLWLQRSSHLGPHDPTQGRHVLRCSPQPCSPPPLLLSLEDIWEVRCGLGQHYCSVTPSWNFTWTSRGSDYNPLSSQRGWNLVLEHL